MKRQLRDILSDIELHLCRIANSIEGINEATNPVKVWDTPDDETVVRAMYSNEDEEIIAAQLAKMGKEYKVRTVKK